MRHLEVQGGENQEDVSEGKGGSEVAGSMTSIIQGRVGTHAEEATSKRQKRSFTRAGIGFSGTTRIGVRASGGPFGSYFCGCFSLEQLMRTF